MIKSKKVLLSSIISLALMLGYGYHQPVTATPHKNHTSEEKQNSQFQSIHQPFWLKIFVTTTGLGLIGLEMWWFLLSKPKLTKR